mmetsp:Transcript_8084/g.25048  ORF Transcript_8084/g.25048 Transcript_8084/m.25048 type:complete len:554 (+) Transcript_8084:242-1903(+)|eukprot:CAMPEP_0174249066 /NCGR_PEP_ID=MMETSP0417-20130205/43393_1 /TAXON_ID=242541 /ORGANISM="Mayorella sp, Strain BSH-02190019" /LENGTH=553 /DNA_ID=CAMNT_0015328935 /DNA_START=144 /DNA_END=1805 /DNA_ORIENTATION=-
MDHTVFQRLSQDTFQRLQELWQEIGTQPSQQEAVLQQLQADLKNVYENTVQRHLDERSRLQKTVQEAQLRLRHLQTILHFPFTEIVQYSTLSETVEKASHTVGQHMQLAEEREQILRERDEHLKRLCQELETEKMLSFNADDLSENAISQYTSTIQNAEALKAQRLRTIEQLSAEIRVLWDELCISPADYSRCPVQCAVANQQPLFASQTHINVLEHAKLQLQHVKAERTEQFAAYARDIKGLWNQLEVSDDDRRAFITNNNRLGMENLHACAVELDRLRSTLQVRMIELCAAKREALEELWDEAGISEQERELCVAYSQQLASEEALASLSHEITEATKYVESIRPVLRAIQRWEEVWQSKIDFEKRSNDPTRLLARDPGRLLREEKERKSIDRLLPRAEKEVRILLQRWETQFNRPFLYHGDRYLTHIDVMKVEEEERKSLEKERRVREKGGSSSSSSGKSGRLTRSARSETQLGTTPGRTRSAKAEGGRAVGTTPRQRGGTTLRQPLVGSALRTPTASTKDTPGVRRSKRTRNVGATPNPLTPINVNTYR